MTQEEGTPEMVDEEKVIVIEEDEHELFKTPQGGKRRLVAAKSRPSSEEREEVPNRDRAAKVLSWEEGDRSVDEGSSAYKGEDISPAKTGDEDELIRDGDWETKGQRSTGRSVGEGQRGSPKRTSDEWEEELVKVRREMEGMKNLMAENEKKRLEEDKERRMIEMQRNLERQAEELRREREEFERQKETETWVAAARRKEEEEEKRKKREVEEEKADRVEVVKSTNEFTKLEPVNAAPEPAVRVGDWLTRVEVEVSNMSQTSGQFWEEVKGRAVKEYEEHQGASPLEKLVITERPMELEGEKKWNVVRAAVSKGLLEAIPRGLAAELVSQRRMHPTQIVFKILVAFAPGGLEERSALLKKLAVYDNATTEAGVVESIRTWERRRIRAQELKLVMPDPSLQMKALMTMVGPVVAKNHELAFNIQSVRRELGVDVNITNEKVSALSRVIEAECLQRVTTEETTGNVKKTGQQEGKEKDTGVVKKMEDMRQGQGKGGQGREENAGGTKGGGKDTGKMNLGLCAFFSKPTGCRQGGQCGFIHQKPEQNDRCWNCGVQGHSSRERTRPKREWGGKGEGTVKGMGETWERKTEKGGKGDGNYGKGQERYGGWKEQQQESTLSKRRTSEESEESREPEKKEEEQKEKKEKEKQEDKAEELIKVLKAIAKMKAARVGVMRKDRQDRVALDSCANRVARTRQESDGELHEEEVEMADGTRKKLQCTAWGTIIVESEVQWLIPLVPFCEMLKMDLNRIDGSFVLDSRVRGVIEVHKDQGVLEIDKRIGAKLIKDYEEKVKKIWQNGKSQEEEDKKDKEIRELIQTLKDDGWSEEELALNVMRHWGRGGEISLVPIGEDEDSGPEEINKILRLRGGGCGKEKEEEAVEDDLEEEERQRCIEEEERMDEGKERSKEGENEDEDQWRVTDELIEEWFEEGGTKVEPRDERETRIDKKTKERQEEEETRREEMRKVRQEKQPEEKTRQGSETAQKTRWGQCRSSGSGEAVGTRRKEGKDVEEKRWTREVKQKEEGDRLSKVAGSMEADYGDEEEVGDSDRESEDETTVDEWKMFHEMLAVYIKQRDEEVDRESRTIWVGNMNWKSKNWGKEEEELYDDFQQAGEIEDFHTYRGKGLARMRYKTKDGAEIAVEMLNGMVFKGRELRVRHQERRKGEEWEYEDEKVAKKIWERVELMKGGQEEQGKQIEEIKEEEMIELISEETDKEGRGEVERTPEQARWVRRETQKARIREMIRAEEYKELCTTKEAMKKEIKTKANREMRKDE